MSSEKDSEAYPVPLLEPQSSSLWIEFLGARLEAFLILYTNTQGLHLHTVNLHFYGDEPILYARELSVDFAQDTFLECI